MPLNQPERNARTSFDAAPRPYVDSLRGDDSRGVNKDRMWMMVEQMIGNEDWTNKIGTLAGCASTAPLRLREVFDSDTRDVLIFPPSRVLVVQPKSSRDLGLFAGLLAAAGRPSNS